jgi:hypothetical protein
MRVANETRAVLFDLFETLVTEFTPDRRACPTLAERFGVDVDIYAMAWRRNQSQRFRGEYPDYPSACAPSVGRWAFRARGTRQ